MWMSWTRSAKSSHGFDGILAVPQLMADVEAEADARVQVLDEFDGALGVGEKLRHVRAMVVDGVLDVVFLDLLVDQLSAARARRPASCSTILNGTPTRVFTPTRLA